MSVTAGRDNKGSPTPSDFLFFRSAANEKLKVLCELFHVKPMMQKDFSKVAGMLWRGAAQETKDEFKKYSNEQRAARGDEPVEMGNGKAASRGVQKKRRPKRKDAAQISPPDHTPWLFPPAEYPAPMFSAYVSTSHVPWTSSASSSASSAWGHTTPISGVAASQNEPFQHEDLPRSINCESMTAQPHVYLNDLVRQNLSHYGHSFVGQTTTGFEVGDATPRASAGNLPQAQRNIDGSIDTRLWTYQWPQQPQQELVAMVPAFAQWPRWNDECAPLDAGFIDFAKFNLLTGAPIVAQPFRPVMQEDFPEQPLNIAHAVPQASIMQAVTPASALACGSHSFVAPDGAESSATTSGVALFHDRTWGVGPPSATMSTPALDFSASSKDMYMDPSFSGAEPANHGTFGSSAGDLTLLSSGPAPTHDDLDALMPTRTAVPQMCEAPPAEQAVPQPEDTAWLKELLFNPADPQFWVSTYPA